MSLQERFFPDSECVVCGPSSTRGLGLRSFERQGAVTAAWSAPWQLSVDREEVPHHLLTCLVECHAYAAAMLAFEACSSGGGVLTADSHRIVVLGPASTQSPLHLFAKGTILSSGGVLVTVSVDSGAGLCLEFEGRYCEIANAVSRRH